MFAEDVSIYFDDFGVLMGFGAITGKVIFDDVAEPVQFGGFGGKTTSITFDPAEFVGLDVGSVVTVNGCQYKVLTPPEGDALMRCNLQKVSP